MQDYIVQNEPTIYFYERILKILIISSVYSLRLMALQKNTFYCFCPLPSPTNLINMILINKLFMVILSVLMSLVKSRSDKGWWSPGHLLLDRN